MPVENEVVVVRFNRRDVGITIPHDKIYFFPLNARDQIPVLFPVALVLPVDTDLIIALRSQQPKKITTRQHIRNDDGLNVTVDTNKGNESVQWWDDNIISKYRLRERVAVVPVLTQKKQLKVLPRYLTSSAWHTRGNLRKKSPPISDLAYLSTRLPPPNDRIRPICSFCPRALLHVQGECTPGQKVCYNYLDLSRLTEESPDASIQSDND